MWIEKKDGELRDIKCKSLAHVTYSLENVNLLTHCTQLYI